MAGRTPAPGAVGGAEDCRSFTDAVALSAAPLGPIIFRADSATAALNGLRAAMGVGRTTKVSGAGVALSLLAGLAAGTVVARISERHMAATRTRRQQESSARLAEAEADIEANQPNVDALLDVIPRAATIMEYIAVHASHALTRWGNGLGESLVLWKNLSESDQQRYRDFVAIAAAQLAVSSLDLEALATLRGDDLEQAGSIADQILIQSHRDVTERV